MIFNLALSVAMVSATVVIHYLGTLALLHAFRAQGHRFQAAVRTSGRAMLIVTVVLGLLSIHGVEIWLYAAVYRLLGVLPDLEAALYFSVVTYTTLGYGDVVLGPAWRLFAALEGVNGLILFSWTTALLTAIILRILDADWRHIVAQIDAQSQPVTKVETPIPALRRGPLSNKPGPAP